MPSLAVLQALEQLKRRRGLRGPFGPLASFEVALEASAILRLQALSAGLVQALMKMAYHVLVGTAGFPTLAALGFTRPMAAFLQSRLPADFRELLVIGRLDVSTDGQRQVSYELNASQPGGMEYLELFGRPPVAALHAHHAEGFTRDQFDRLYACYVGAALQRFEARTGHGRPRGILLLGHGYHLLEVQRVALARALRRRISCAADGAACEVEGAQLWWRDERGRRHPIDLVFRSPRASFEALLRRENATIRQAWTRGGLTLVNPPHAKVVGWKALAAYLDDERLLDQAAVTVAERQAIAALVPATVAVDRASLPRFRDERSEWVLKGPRAGRGKLVWLGAQTPQRIWQQKLDSAARQSGWICQRLQPPFALEIMLHDAAGTVCSAPASIDPYVVIGAQSEVPAFLCRAVIPSSDDPAELTNVKLNLLGDNHYVDAGGVRRPRQVGFGFVRTS